MCVGRVVRGGRCARVLWVYVVVRVLWVYAVVRAPGFGICRILTMHVLIKGVHSFFVLGVFLCSVLGARCLCASQIQYHFEC